MVEKIGDLRSLEQIARKVSIFLFDLDGTLVDTDYANYLSYRRAVEQIIGSRFYLTFNSERRITRKVIRDLIPDLSYQHYRSIIKVKEVIYPDYLNETKINHGIINILDSYLNKKIVLATNSYKKRASLLLEWHKIFNKFDCCYYRENMVTYLNKFEYVLYILNISGSSVAVFEDDLLEIEKAISAGIPTENIFNVASNV